MSNFTLEPLACSTVLSTSSCFGHGYCDFSAGQCICDAVGYTRNTDSFGVPVNCMLSVMALRIAFGITLMGLFLVLVRSAMIFWFWIRTALVASESAPYIDLIKQLVQVDFPASPRMWVTSIQLLAVVPNSIYYGYRFIQPDTNLMGVDFLPTLFFGSISWLLLLTILLRMRMLMMAADLEIQRSDNINTSGATVSMQRLAVAALIIYEAGLILILVESSDDRSRYSSLYFGALTILNIFIAALLYRASVNLVDSITSSIVFLSDILLQPTTPTAASIATTPVHRNLSVGGVIFSRSPVVFYSENSAPIKQTFVASTVMGVSDIEIDHTPSLHRPPTTARSISNDPTTASAQSTLSLAKVVPMFSSEPHPNKHPPEVCSPPRRSIDQYRRLSRPPRPSIAALNRAIANNDLEEEPPQFSIHPHTMIPILDTSEHANETKSQIFDPSPELKASRRNILLEQRQAALTKIERLQTCAADTKSRVRFLVAMYTVLTVLRLITAVWPPLFLLVVVVEPWLFIIAGFFSWPDYRDWITLYYQRKIVTVTPVAVTASDRAQRISVHRLGLT